MSASAASTGVRQYSSSKILEVQSKNPVSALPTPLETWEHQQRVKQNPGDSVQNNARRILPLPSGRRKEFPESDSARNVRLLLARHQQAGMQHPKPVDEDIKRHQPNIQQVSDTGSDISDQFSSALLPGDSYPEVGKKLLSMDEEEEDFEEEEVLLRRLNQSQARMEQIKRMLVTQRGFIVQALKQMAETKSCSRCENPVKEENPEKNEVLERDRTIGSTLKRSAEQRQKMGAAENVRLCPMCEAVFPIGVDPDEFELHVVEHFEFDEPDTLKYIGSGEEEGT